jgi:hypothetical protein
MGYFGCDYRVSGGAMSVQTRVIYFETDGWASRLYSFESDLQNSMLSPAFYMQGWRWYVSGKVDIKKINQLS